jgi:DNA-binding response OmpR family regulator
VKEDGTSPPPKSILCVEDNKDTCEMLGILFSDYEFVSAQSFEKAFAFIEERSFDLYILDNWLPDGSGVELCRKIRLADPRVPIIFVSGVGYESDIKEARDAGASEYLVKPCEPDKIEKIVKELLK